MTTHTITTTWNEIEVEIAYDFVPETQDRDYGFAVTIGHPAEVAFISATAKLHEGETVNQSLLDRWAESWLHGVGYELAVANAVKGAKS